MHFHTADLCDRFENDISVGLQVAEPMFNDFGGKRAFYGEIVTLKVFEDNSLVREILKESGKGKVLVVDGGGSLRCALFGDQLGLLAQNNGWQGIVIYGCVRDSDVLAEMNIGVRALATQPQRSRKKGIGEKGIPVHFADTTFMPGEWICVDGDGIIVLKKAPVCSECA
ncbi:MAG: ribonuclease E activity regulator RraA [Burkholderiales bacterium]|nr:ribonuclease E activity regulator RraA [Burkholderiales bacterium]